MKKIFVNKNKQVRSGWKIFITLLTFFLAANILSTIIAVIFTIITMISAGTGTDLQELILTVMSNKTLEFIMQIVQCVCMILAVLLFWKVFDKKPLKKLGFTSPIVNLKDLIYGLVFGALSITVVFIVLLQTNQITLVNSISQPNVSWFLISDLVLFVFVGINEELFSRGYCMSVLKQTNSVWAMVLVSSVVFSVIHALNPNINTVGFLNIFLVGILFAFMFLKRGNLWMPIGYHITWNYFQGSIFGFKVSGQTTNGLYQLDLPFENYINGGAFGPEAGVVTTGVIILGVIIVCVLNKKGYAVKGIKQHKV